MNTQQTALDTDRARTCAIHAKLARLQQRADDHCGHDRMLSNGGTWAIVGGWSLGWTRCWRLSTATAKGAGRVLARSGRLGNGDAFAHGSIRFRAPTVFGFPPLLTGVG